MCIKRKKNKNNNTHTQKKKKGKAPEKPNKWDKNWPQALRHCSQNCQRGVTLQWFGWSCAARARPEPAGSRAGSGSPGRRMLRYCPASSRPRAPARESGRALLLCFHWLALLIADNTKHFCNYKQWVSIRSTTFQTVVNSRTETIK